MNRCLRCQETIPIGAAACPACGLASASGGLARDPDRGVAAALQRVELDSLMERFDVSGELTRALSEQNAIELSLADIDQALDRVETQSLPSLDQLEHVLAGDDFSRLSLNGLQLADLLEDGVDAKTLLRRGMLFLKNRLYAEALDWWSLNRDQLARPESRVHLLLLVMEVFTCTLAGNVQRAALVQHEMSEHPIYKQLKQRRLDR